MANDAERDLALVRIPANRRFKAIKIGDVSQGEEVSIRTLDTSDWFYLDGPNLLAVSQLRYSGQISSPDHLKVQELERMYSALEQKINELGSQMSALMNPYFPESETEKVREGDTLHSLPDSSPTKKTIEELSSDRNAYRFIGKTDGDRAVPGMSGSGVFNERGELVGVAVRREKRQAGYGTGSLYGFAYTEDMPDELTEKLRIINEQRNVLGREQSEVERELYLLFNPVIDTDAAVSPQAILAFLKSYCDSTEVQPQASAMQFSGNSRRIEESLENKLWRFTQHAEKVYAFFSH